MVAGPLDIEVWNTAKVFGAGFLPVDPVPAPVKVPARRGPLAEEGKFAGLDAAGEAGDLPGDSRILNEMGPEAGWFGEGKRVPA